MKKVPHTQKLHSSNMFFDKLKSMQRRWYSGHKRITVNASKTLDFLNVTRKR